MQSDFSKIISTSQIGADGFAAEYVASDEERIALAKRFNILSLDSFIFAVNVSCQKQDAEYRVTGEIRAVVTQESVVSLEPFSYEISDSFQTLFSASSTEEDGEGFGSSNAECLEIDLESEDTEPLLSDKIDVGKIAAEYLALAIQPFPKKEGEVFTYHDKGLTSDSAKTNPFSCLEKLVKAPSSQEKTIKK